MTGTDLEPALRPVREALLRRARADAERLLADAQRDADAVLADAEREAEELRRRARDRGEAEADGVVAAERARARRLVRSAELAARSAAYRKLRAETIAALRGLRDEPGYPRLRERLAAEARRLLGPDAVLTDAPGGGVLGEVAGARVDCSLDAFAEHAVAGLGPRLDRLWAP